MDDTIFTLLVDGFFDCDDAVQCDLCRGRIQGDYFTNDDGDKYCLKCVDNE